MDPSRPVAQSEYVRRVRLERTAECSLRGATEARGATKAQGYRRLGVVLGGETAHPFVGERGLVGDAAHEEQLVLVRP